MILRRVTPLLLLLAADVAGADSGWKHVTRDDGILVTMREVPGRDFPTFRGVGVIDANMYQVLAVMSDVKRHREWMDRCVDSRQLRKISELEYIVYTRTDVPWPVADRDAVFHSRVQVDLQRYVVDIRFQAVRNKLMAPVDGVVRMTDLRGHYRLQALSKTKTLVEMMIDADPKGSLPTWIAKLATKRLPLYTLRKLRRQAKRTMGWYEARIKRWKAGRY